MVKNDELSCVASMVKLANQYRWLLDAFVSDAFVRDYIQEIPCQWKKTLETLEPPALAVLLDAQAYDKSQVWPLSLLAFKATCHAYSMPRKPVDTKGIFAKGDRDRTESGSTCKGQKDSIDSNEIKNGQYMSLDHCYRRHVKPKKQHEIKILGEVVNSLCQRQGCSHVVDIGAGQGHLSRVLSFGYGLKVTTVEAAGCHIPKAKKFDREVIKDMKRLKHKNRIQGNDDSSNIPLEPNHIATWIEPDISPEDFLVVIEQSNVEELDQTDQNHNNSAIDEKEGTQKLEKYCNCINGVILNDGTLSSQANLNYDNENCGDDAAKVARDNRCLDSFKVCQAKCDVCGLWKKDVCDFVPNGVVGGVQESNFVNTSLVNNDSVEKVEVRNCDEKMNSCEVKKEEKNGLIESNDEVVITKGSGVVRQGVELPVISALETWNCGQKEQRNITMTGLHACGDLIPTMLRVFCRCPQLTGLATVACCYMKLSVDESDYPSTGPEVGYPMSKFVQSLPNHQLGYTARNLACHFLDSYHQRLNDNSPELILHCYRAALQEIILDTDPTINHGAIKLTIKRSHQMPFEQYASLALKKLGLDHTITQAELDRAAARIAKWKDVVILYILREMLAPVVEGLLLLDRVIFLGEQGIKSQLVPIFDPNLSPRNFALLAYKDKVQDEKCQL